ncbi:MAG: hypothetical protein JWQ23_1431 [Herminiimonas sp.]|nr:hypothetical protein [Herminiimonas sp.]
MSLKKIEKTDLLDGVGAMRARMRTHCWADSPLGHPDTWPPALRTIAGMVLDSKFPMFVAWGPGFGSLYNDAYAEILGARHPAALGRRFQDIWADIWPVIHPLVEQALAGEATFSKDSTLTMRRNGHEEQTWFTFSYSPLRDDSGAVAGMLCTCIETTGQVLAERRQAFQLELADRLRGLSAPTDITAMACEFLGRHLDVTRVGYSEVDQHLSVLNVSQGWTDGTVPSVIGRTFPLEAFGQPVTAEVRAGYTVRIVDIDEDERSAAYARTYAGLGIRSILIVPLIKAGRLSSILAIGMAAPRRWTDQDVMLAQEVAERTWDAVERAQAEQNERKAKEALSRRLADEGDRLRALFEQAPGFMAVLRGPNHVFELANAAFIRLVGEREVLGMPVREALPDLEGQGFFEMLDGVFDSGKPFHAHEARVLFRLTPDAPAVARFVNFIYQPVIEADGLVSGIFVEGYDATERKLADQALRETQERLREGLAAGRMVVWDWNVANGQVTLSENAKPIFGGARHDEAAAWSWVHPDDVQKFRDAATRAFRERGQFETLVRMVPPSGELIWTEARGKVVRDAAGNPLSIRGISIDVTKRTLAEEGLREADRRKDEFLAMLAHELRNPLAPISTAAELLKLINVDEPRVRQSSEIISRQVGHMTRIVDDLLDVSRVTRGLVTIDKEALDLRDLVSGAVDQVRALIDARGHHLTLQLPPVPAPVRGDQTRLVQVIANLLNNAARYTPNGGQIVLRIDVRAGQVELCVHDDGIGIAPDLLPHLFELFAQGKRSPDRTQGGLGLGLALVKSLVELHDGSIAVHSEGAGKGSAFTIRLPRLNEEKQQRERMDMPNTAASAERLSLMIVDDNMDAANSLAMVLEAAGHHVTVAYAARTALERAAIAAPRVFLLDIGLPDMDGYELAGRLRAHPETKYSVLIALTGYGQGQDRERSSAAGFDYHLVKPADPAQLESLLAQIT